MESIHTSSTSVPTDQTGLAHIRLVLHGQTNTTRSYSKRVATQGQTKQFRNLETSKFHLLHPEFDLGKLNMHFDQLDNFYATGE
jgi:hypothetical protein